MPKVKDSEIKNLTTSKRVFISALKKVSQRVEKPIIKGKVNKSG